jgi:hypothetical protein
LGSTSALSATQNRKVMDAKEYTLKMYKKYKSRDERAFILNFLGKC